MPPQVTGTSWPAGVIWGSQAGNANNAQVNLAEFTIGGAGGQDTYDISNVVRLTRIRKSSCWCKMNSACCPAAALQDGSEMQPCALFFFDTI